MKKLPNILFRIFLKFAYAASLVFCFIFRPAVHSAIIAIWSNKRFLIIQNSYYEKYVIPGGFVKIGENPVDAAVREIKEEVGIITKPNRLMSMGEIKGTFRFKRETIHCYELRLNEKPDIVLDNREVIWYEFLSLDEALKLNLSSPVRLFLNKYVG